MALNLKGTYKLRINVEFSAAIQGVLNSALPQQSPRPRTGLTLLSYCKMFPILPKWSCRWLIFAFAAIFVGKMVLLVGESRFGFSHFFVQQGSIRIVLGGGGSSHGSRTKVTPQFEQFAPNTTKKQEPVILEQSWKEKMLHFFSSKECLPSSSPASSQPSPPSWFGQMLILVGAMKGGSKAIHTYLEQHPQFVSRCHEKHATNELRFFNNLNRTDQPMNKTDLQMRYSRLLEEKCPLAVESLRKDRQKMYLDDTPNYMQDSDFIPPLLSCVVPKAKIIAVLRNPTERAFSHFNFYRSYKLCTTNTFDEWVDLEIRTLTDAGIVNAKDPYEELLAWQRYNIASLHQRQRMCKTFVTRGLYAIQALHFITALEAAGRPQSDIHFIHSEDMRGDQRQLEYDKMLNFLGLQNHTLQQSAEVHKTGYTSIMNESTRVRLDEFFRPYNRRLYELLNWKPVWD